MAEQNMDMNSLLEHAEECQEIVQWWDTGILPDGKIRQRANDPKAPWSETNSGDPRMAEREIVSKVIRKIAALANGDINKEGNQADG